MSWHGVHIAMDCCFSELASYTSNSELWSSTKSISPTSHHKVTCSRQDMAEKIAQLAFNNKQLLTRKYDFNIGICWFYTKQT
jgi:hypothetical protein